MSLLAPRPCLRHEDGQWRVMEDVVTPEAAMRVLLPGGETLSLTAYPQDLETLALGAAALHRAGEAVRPVLRSRDGQDFQVDFVPSPLPAPRVWAGPLPPEDVLLAMDRLLGGDGLWEGTGCFHRAGLWDPASRSFLAMAEDIPRHNCLDRLAGWLLSAEEGRARHAGDLALFVSARATASLFGKVVRLGVPVFCTRAAPTGGGLAMARSRGVALAAFVKRRRFTVFLDPHGRLGQPWDPVEEGSS